MFLRGLDVRPVYARVASDNAGSLKVLRKAGFTIIGTEVSYAAARGAEIEETILRLRQLSRADGSHGLSTARR